MKRILASLVAAAAIAGGAAAATAIGSSPAIAQEESQTPTPSPSQEAAPEGSGHWCGGAGLQRLVDAGTITQAQADAIAAALQAARESGQIPGRGSDPAAKAAAIDGVLDSLVEKGTITQAQADAVAAAKPMHRKRTRGSEQSSTDAAASSA